MDINNSLIPDPVADGAENIPAPTVHSEPEDGPLIPDNIDPKAETGSLVPDAAVVESSKTEPAAPATPAKDYTLPPEPTAPAEDLPTAGMLKNDSDTKEKKKPNFKLIGIIVGAVVAVAALALLFIFVILPMIEKNNRGAVDTEAKAMVVAESLSGDTKYAIFNEKGQPISDFIYSSISDFVDGYAIVADETGEKVGVITAGGKMSINFGTYETIERHGSFYSAITDGGQRKLIRGNNEEVTKYTGDIIDYEKCELILVKVDGKYRLYRENGEIAFEFDSEPKLETLYSDKALVIESKQHVDVVNLITNQTTISQDISFEYNDVIISRDYQNMIASTLKDEDGQYRYGIYYRGQYKEIVSSLDSLSFEEVDLIYPESGYYIYGDAGDYSYRNHSNRVIMNENFELIPRPHQLYPEGSSMQDDYFWFDADHWVHVSYPVGDSDNRKVEFYVDGKKVNELNNVSDVDIVDGKYHLYLKDSKQCLYDLSGKESECSTLHHYVKSDVYGNHVKSYTIYDKDYGTLADYKDIWGKITVFADAKGRPINNLYIVGDLHETYVFLVDAKTGKDVTKRELYKKIEYDKTNNIYLATRDDDSTDIIGENFEVLSNIVGKITPHQNYIEAKGGSVTELYTINGEKFYTYK